jgi:hypothetical protein
MMPFLRTKFVISIILNIFICLISNAQNDNYLKKSFDLSIEKMPTNFLGHNPVEVFKTLEKREIDLQKDEFETTEDYEKRIQILKNKISNDWINHETLFSFIPSKQDLKISSFNYNADKQELELEMKLDNFTDSNNKIDFDDKRKTIELKETNVSKKKYEGKNVYGVSKEVHSKYSNIYSLLINNSKDFINVDNLSFDLIKFKINVNPIIAKKIKELDLYGHSGQLSFIYIGKVNEPFTTKGFYNSGTPTLKTPIEIYKDLNYINFNLTEIWVFNKVTGEILTKIKPNEKLTCKVDYKLNDCNLMIEQPDAADYNFTQEGSITFKIMITINGKGENNILIRDDGTSSDITSEAQKSEARNFIRKLKFKCESRIQQGTITLTFNSFNVNKLKFN